VPPDTIYSHSRDQGDYASQLNGLWDTWTWLDMVIYAPFHWASRVPTKSGSPVANSRVLLVERCSRIKKDRSVDIHFSPLAMSHN
jgi:hypothetical protein